MFPFFIRGADGEPHQILIYDVIGAFYWEDSITAKQIIAALAEVTGEDVLVRINCRGGDHMDGIAIYNALAEHSGDVTFRIEGYACSMGSVIVCAGAKGKVQMYETSLGMLHRSSTYLYGNVNELLAAAEMLEKSDNSIAIAYGRKTGKKPEEMLAVIDERRDTWLSAEDMKTLGIVDEVIVPQKFTALLDKKAVTALAANEGAAILEGLPLPKAVQAALEGVSGVVAFHIDGQKIEPIKAQAEPNPPPADDPPADDPPADEPPAGDPPADNPPAGDPPDSEEEKEDEPPPADPPPDPIQAERERVKAIRAQAKTCGVPADDDLVDQLIDEGVSVAMAGKMLLAVKRSTQHSTAIRSNHHSEQPQGDAEQVQASWGNVYKNLPGRR